MANRCFTSSFCAIAFSIVAAATIAAGGQAPSDSSPGDTSLAGLTKKVQADRQKTEAIAALFKKWKAVTAKTDEAGLTDLVTSSIKSVPKGDLPSAWSASYHAWQTDSASLKTAIGKAPANSSSTGNKSASGGTGSGTGSSAGSSTAGTTSGSRANGAAEPEASNNSAGVQSGGGGSSGAGADSSGPTDLDAANKEESQTVAAPDAGAAKTLTASFATLDPVFSKIIIDGQAKVIKLEWSAISAYPPPKKISKPAGPSLDEMEAALDRVQRTFDVFDQAAGDLVTTHALFGQTKTLLTPPETPSDGESAMGKQPSSDSSPVRKPVRTAAATKPARTAAATKPPKKPAKNSGTRGRKLTRAKPTMTRLPSSGRPERFFKNSGVQTQSPAGPALSNGSGTDSPTEDGSTQDSSKVAKVAKYSDADSAYQKLLGSMLKQAAGWLRLMRDGLDQQNQTFYAPIKRGLKDSDLTPALEADLNRSQSIENKLHDLIGRLDGWSADLKKCHDDKDFKLDLTAWTAESKAFAKGIPDVIAILHGYQAILNDAMGGLGEDTVQQQIRLFYFNNVPEAIKALNLNAVQYTGDPFFQFTSDYETTRSKLLKAETDLQTAIGGVNQLVSRQDELEHDINNDIAQDQAFSQVQQSVSDAIDLLTARKLAATDKAQIADLTNQINTETDRKNRAGQQLTQLEGDQASKSGELSDLQKKLATAQTQVADAVTKKNALTLQISGLAEAEVTGAGQERDRHTFWIAMPRKTSLDPVKRCMVFGYDDSNTIFVRGAAHDLQTVRDILAEFDRPAPQAKISLYTLQMNGSDAKQVAQDVSEVTDSLNALEGNITLIEDSLRDALSAEVSRSAVVAKMCFTDSDHSIDWPQRMWRSYYYSREIREKLGLDVEAPGQIGHEQIANIRYALASCIEDLDTVVQRYRAAQDNEEHVLGYLPAQNQEGGDKTQPAGAANNSSSAQSNRSNVHHGTSGAKKSTSAVATGGNGAELLEQAKTSRTINLTRADYAFRQVLSSVLSSDYVRKLLLQPCVSSTLERIKSYQADLTAALVASKSEAADSTTEISYVQMVRKTSTKKSCLPADYGSKCVFEDEKILERALLCGLKEVCVPTVDPAYADSEKYVTSFTLPDPAKGTTLGEMLFAFSMGSADSRDRVLHAFAQNLFDSELKAFVPTRKQSASAYHEFVQALHDPVLYLAHFRNTHGHHSEHVLVERSFMFNFTNALEALYGNSEGVSPKSIDSGFFPYFPQTIRGEEPLPDHVGPASDALSPNQKEILSAIDTRVVESVSNHLSDLCLAAQAQPPLSDYYKAQAAPLVGWLANHPFEGSFKEAKRLSDWTSAVRDFGVLAERPSVKGSYTAANSAGFIGSRFLLTAALPNTSTGAASPGWIVPGLQLAAQAAHQNSLVRANPRVAAADDMIKRFIVVLEGDLHHFLIDPTLDNMRQNTAKGVEFGSMEEESILATNRFAARVDASSSASLGSPDLGTSAATVTQQLATIKDGILQQTAADRKNAIGSAVAVGTAAGAAQFSKANTTTIAKIGLLGGILGGLFNQEEPLTEVYSLHGGSQFKVTPIFDPSGQAMRFKFDHVATVNVQDPTSTNTALIPRVDRHTINTEVQLSNAQFQVISSFDLNTQVGTPLRKTGGIAPFNQIWPFKDIPIIGYYTSRKTAAVRQHSLIFASTILYPTVGDIVNLLVETPPSVVPSAPKLAKDIAMQKSETTPDQGEVPGSEDRQHVTPAHVSPPTTLHQAGRIKPPVTAHINNISVPKSQSWTPVVKIFGKNLNRVKLAFMNGQMVAILLGNDPTGQPQYYLKYPAGSVPTVGLVKVDLWLDDQTVLPLSFRVSRLTAPVSKSKKTRP